MTNDTNTMTRFMSGLFSLPFRASIDPLPFRAVTRGERYQSVHAPLVEKCSDREIFLRGRCVVTPI